MAAPTGIWARARRAATSRTRHPARLIRAAERGLAARRIADPVAAEVEAEWRAHLGERLYEQLREGLTRLREITDPYA